jgi:tyrosyl-tRNA synthetase
MLWKFLTTRADGTFATLAEVISAIMYVSRAEARRLIKQRAINMRGVRIHWENANIMEDIVGEHGWMKVGKKSLFHYDLSDDEQTLTICPYSEWQKSRV